MKALKVLEIKTFMSQLFLGEAFDSFLLYELEIQTANHYKISGRLNRRWYDNDELMELGGREFSLWKEMRGFAFQIIKGNKSPQSMKIVFSLPKENIKKVLERSGADFLLEQVKGLFLNVKYENEELDLYVQGVEENIISLNSVIYILHILEYQKKNQYYNYLSMIT